MATSSILGGTRLPQPVAGKDTDALGPSDNSDSGSDVQGAYGEDELASDSDAFGTGERATAGPGVERADADILPDHIENENGSDPDVSPDGLPLEGNGNVEDLIADDDSENIETD